MTLFLKIYLLLGWAFFIFRLLALPFAGSGAPSPWQIDKLIHFFLFGVFAILAFVVFSPRKKSGYRRPVLFSLALSFGYAAVLEIFQFYVPGRSPTPADLLAGSAGAVLFLSVFCLARDRRPRLLLHVCCAVCAADLAESLKKEFAVTFYFYNPNIYPAEEYRRRRDETRRLARASGLRLLEGPYEHEKWRAIIAGHENEPEKGGRCRRCYFLRLKKAARIARNKGFDFFATTLTVSPHKDADSALAIGRALASRYNIEFLDRDFKKQDGFKKAVARARELGLYCQDYCGCEYSIRKRT